MGAFERDRYSLCVALAGTVIELRLFQPFRRRIRHAICALSHFG